MAANWSTLMLDDENAAELKARSKDFPSWDLTSRQIRDLELLLSGGFSPCGVSLFATNATASAMR